MTILLAGIKNAAEAEIAIAQGVDLIDFVDPARDVPSAPEAKLVDALVKVVAGRRETCAFAPGEMHEPRRLRAAPE